MPVPLDILVLQLPSIVVIADDFELLDGICDWLLADAAELADVGVVIDVEVTVVLLVAAAVLDVFEF